VNGEGILQKAFLGYPLMTKSQYGIVQCKKIIDVTSDVKTFVFETQKPIFFIPGQNATFNFRMNDFSNSRTWTLTGSPDDKSLQVTIKRKKGGVVSNWMLDKMKVGSQLSLVDIDGKFGIFMMKELPKKILFLSGGIGITPFFAMLKRLSEISMKNIDIILAHSESQEIPFHDELIQITSKLPNLKIYFTLTKEEKEMKNIENVTYTKGRFSKEFIEKKIEDYKEREIFLCGPDFFMDTCIVALQELGKNEIHVESFDY
jgi:ferredoxin-NADP reductase